MKKEARTAIALASVLAFGCQNHNLAPIQCAQPSDCEVGLICLEGQCSWCRSDLDCVAPAKCGVPRSGICGCFDGDGDGSSCDDCNDSDATIFPSASETCDGKDNNCNGLVDEGVRKDFYADQDRDGFGDPALHLTGCVAPPGYVENHDDCNDADPTAHPGALEVCDARDNNCNGQVDEGVKKVYYRDVDGDGFGDAHNTLTACIVPASGYVEVAGDCDDTRADVNPDAEESCNGRDDNCDGVVDELSRSCDNACGPGVETCQHGNWTGCTAPASVTVNTVTSISGPTAHYDCITVTRPGRLVLAPEMKLTISNWLRVEAGGILELGPRAIVEATGDLVFVDSSILLASDGTLQSGSSIQVLQDAKWYAQSPQAVPYSGGGSRSCADSTQQGVSGAGGGSRGGSGGQGGTCGAFLTQPVAGIGGLWAVAGADGSACPATSASAGAAPSGGGGGAPVSGGGGGANGGTGGNGAGGIFMGTAFVGGAGGATEAHGVPLFGGGGGGSAGAADAVAADQSCEGTGGSGGGIVRVRAPSFINQGLLFADGQLGETPWGSFPTAGGGGGGGGGTWVFSVATFDNRGAISAVGGVGGNGHCYIVGARCGGGGGGGGGRVFIGGLDGGAPLMLQGGNIYVAGGLGGAGWGGAENGAPGTAGTTLVGD